MILSNLEATTTRWWQTGAAQLLAPLLVTSSHSTLSLVLNVCGERTLSKPTHYTPWYARNPKLTPWSSSEAEIAIRIWDWAYLVYEHLASNCHIFLWACNVMKWDWKVCHALLRHAMNGSWGSAMDPMQCSAMRSDAMQCNAMQCKTDKSREILFQLNTTQSNAGASHMMLQSKTICNVWWDPFLQHNLFRWEIMQCSVDMWTVKLQICRALLKDNVDLIPGRACTSIIWCHSAVI